MKSAILVVNAGSSSHKCKIFSADPLKKAPLWEGALDWSIEAGELDMHARNGQEAPIDRLLSANTKNPLEELLATINFPYSLIAIGHRVVHGGVTFHSAVQITPEVKEAIRSLIPLAPLHNPANLKGIEAMETLFPGTPQFAIFDTAFHATIPAYAAEYPIPQAWTNLGIRRYGFHGISHSYCSRRAAEILKKNSADLNLITCHLGNGSSITAVERGRSIDTSMGFTPLEGVMMGTRSGSIDPGIVFYLMREKRLSAEEIEHALNHDSGLKAISGNDGDMRHVIKGISLEDPDSELAFDMYVYSIAREIGAMAAALGHVDGIVFTAGIGENCPLVRAEASNKLACFGAQIDTDKNLSCDGDQVISAEGSSVEILTIHTQEEWAIAEACLSMLQAAKRS